MQVMTPLETMAMILAVAAGTVITRFLPFWLFPESKGDRKSTRLNSSHRT